MANTARRVRRLGAAGSAVRLLAAAVVAAATLAAVSLMSAAPASATSSFTFSRLYGQDRFGTAAAIAEAAFPNGASTAVVATGLNFPDALAGSYLAGVLDAPILLVQTHDPVPQSTLQALSALKVKNVVILGGPAAVGTDVQQTLSETPSTSSAGGNLDVSRLYNQDGCSSCNRYDTMEAVDTVSPTDVGTVNGDPTGILATGQNFPDALGAGPLAFAKHFPLILTDGSQSTLTPQAQAVISTDKITHLIVVGGPAAIDPSQYDNLPGVSVDTTATTGKDRSQTSELLAEDEVTNFGFTDATFDVANGYDPSFSGQPPGFSSDALAGAPFGGLTDTPTLITLSPTDPGSATDFASKEASTLVGTGHAFGGTAAIADSTLAAIAQAGGGSYPAASNATYLVTPTASQTVGIGTPVTYTATNLGSAPVDIALYQAGNVSRTSSGAYTFVSSGGVAQQGTVAAVITSVNGTAVSSPSSSVDGVTPANGSVTFTVDSQSAESDDPVVYEQRSPADNNLVVNSSGEPTQPFGVGGTVTWGVPPTTTNAPISIATSEGDHNSAHTGFLYSGDTLTVVFDQSVEVAATFDLMVTDGTNVVQVNNQNATVSLSTTNVPDDTVTYTLTADPSTTCTGCVGSEPSLKYLEVLSQEGVQNASGQQWDLPASGISPGGGPGYCQVSNCTRVFGGTDPDVSIPPAPTVVTVTPPDTVVVTCPAAGDAIKVYDLDGVLLGSTGSSPCSSTGNVTITTTTAFGQGQPLLVTATGPSAANGNRTYESLATDPPLMVTGEGSATGGYINVLWDEPISCPNALTAGADFTYTPSGGSPMSPSNASCNSAGTILTLDFSVLPLSKGAGALSYSPPSSQFPPPVVAQNQAGAPSPQTIPVTVGT
jgi:putative cell wall-binding protein